MFTISTSAMISATGTISFFRQPPFFFSFFGFSTTGAGAGAGVGLRLLLAQSARMELQLGYQMNMRRPEIYADGAHDVSLKGVKFNQYAHILQFGVNIYVF